MLPVVAETVLLPVDPPLVVPHPFGREWRSLQQRWLIPHQRKWAEEQAQLRLIEQTTGLTRQTLKSLQNGEYACSAHTAFAISAVRKNFAFLQFLAERVHVGLIPTLPLRSLPPGDFFRHLCVEHMAFFDLVLDFVEEDTALNDEQMAELEQQAQDIIQEIQAWVQKAKEDREKARTK